MNTIYIRIIYNLYVLWGDKRKNHVSSANQ